MLFRVVVKLDFHIFAGSGVQQVEQVNHLRDF